MHVDSLDDNEVVQRLRFNLLESLFELSSIHLQAACWTNPHHGNPHFTFVEFMESCDCKTEESLANLLQCEVIREDEFQVLQPLASLLDGYHPPGEDWYNHEAVLKDPEWRKITDSADVALKALLSLSFNDPRWTKH
jgi:hypothetical protein